VTLASWRMVGVRFPTQVLTQCGPSAVPSSPKSSSYLRYHEVKKKSVKTKNLSQLPNNCSTSLSRTCEAGT